MRDLGAGIFSGPITPPAAAIAHAARLTLAEAALAVGNPDELAGMLDMIGLR